MQKKEIKIRLEDIKAEILYHKYRNFNVNTLLISFNQKHRIISTFEGYREVRFVANHYQPSKLSEKTMKNYDKFCEDFPNILGIEKDDIAFLSTGANMNNLEI